MMGSLDSKKILPLLKDTHTSFSHIPGNTARQVSRKCDLVPKSLIIRKFPIGCGKNAIYRRENGGSQVVAPSKSKIIRDKQANDFDVKGKDVPLGITKSSPNNLKCLEKRNLGHEETIFKVLKESESNVVAPSKANISDEQVDEEGKSCALGFVRSPKYDVSSEAQCLGHEETFTKEVKGLSLLHNNDNFLLLIDQEGHKSIIGSTDIDMRSKYLDLAKKTDNVSTRNQIPFESSGIQRPSTDLSEVKDVPKPIKLSDQPAAPPLAPSASVERRPATYSSEVNDWREPIKMSDQSAAQPLPPSLSVDPHSSSVLQAKDVIARPICKRYSSFRRVSAIRVFPRGCGKNASRDNKGLASEAAVSLDNRTLVDATSSTQVVAPQSTNTDVEVGFNMRAMKEEPEVENLVLKNAENDFPIGYGSLDINRLTSDAAVSSENCTLLHANSSIQVTAPQSTNKDAEYELTMKDESHLEIVALKNAEKDILPKNNETKLFPVGPEEQRIIMVCNDEKALVATKAVKRETEEEIHFLEAPEPITSNVEKVHSAVEEERKLHVDLPMKKRRLESQSFRRVSAIRVFPRGCGKNASRAINGLTSEAAVSLDNRALVDATSSTQVVAPQSTTMDVEDRFNMRTTTKEEPEVENIALKNAEKDFPIGYGLLDINRLTSEATVSSENCTLLHANSKIQVASPQSTNKDAEYELTMGKAMKEESHLEIVALKNAEKDILPKNKETELFPVGQEEQRIIMANNDEKALVATIAVKQKTEEEIQFPVILEAPEPITSNVEKIPSAVEEKRKLHVDLPMKRRLESQSYDASLNEAGTGYTEEKQISSGSEGVEPINLCHYSARKKLMEKLSMFRVTYHKLLMEEYKGTVNGTRTDLVAHKFYKAGNSRCDDHHKYLGSVPGVEIGDKFHRRVELCIAGLHSQHQAGIDYMKQNGTSIAVSIVSSGRYGNDTADTDVLLYSGAGVPNQDQKLKRGNLALKNSMDAQIPVRVIYGFKKYKHRAKTVTTYIYDGLYLVENFCCKMGDCGHNIFIFCLRRIEGQPEGIIGVKRSGSPRVRSFLSAADISQGNEDIPIPAKNFIDQECPFPFKYTPKMIYPSQCSLIPPQGCDCVDGCSDSNRCTCAVKNGGQPEGFIGVKRSRSTRVHSFPSAADISQGNEDIPIPVKNFIDQECPFPFKHTPKMIYPSQCSLIPPQGCDCVDGCSDSNWCACAVKNGGQPEGFIGVKRSRSTRVHSFPSAADMSQGNEDIPIPVKNFIDQECPFPFKYTPKMIYPSQCSLIPPQGCDCVDGCSDSNRCKCAVKNGGTIPFSYGGAIKKVKPVVYECGPSCKCPPTCHNRLSQHGIKLQLEVFKTESRGWGVRSPNFIPSGTFICEYAGELLSEEEAAKRTIDEYLFDVGIKNSMHRPKMSFSEVQKESCTIDAYYSGNVGRFINHSCSPNLYAQNLFYDHENGNMPHIMLFARKDIPPLQELTYDYHYGTVQDSNGRIMKKTCFCGSTECTGRLY